MSRPVKNARHSKSPDMGQAANNGKSKSFGDVKKTQGNVPIGPNYEAESKPSWEGPAQITNRFTSKGD